MIEILGMILIFIIVSYIMGFFLWCIRIKKITKKFYAEIKNCDCNQFGFYPLIIQYFSTIGVHPKIIPHFYWGKLEGKTLEYSNYERQFFEVDRGTALSMINSVENNLFWYYNHSIGLGKIQETLKELNAIISK